MNTNITVKTGVNVVITFVIQSQSSVAIFENKHLRNVVFVNSFFWQAMFVKLVTLNEMNKFNEEDLSDIILTDKLIILIFGHVLKIFCSVKELSHG